MEITVFTPTFNRAYTLGRLYQSLQSQTFREFEWLIIDDGSTDNTEELVRGFIDDNTVLIRYKKTANHGKHIAINEGAKLADGRLFFIVDSDDYLTPDALQKVLDAEKSIPDNEKQKYAGVCGLRGYSDKVIIGTTFSGTYLDITSLERDKYNISGDKAEVYYTKLLQKYPFPQFDDEKFCTECVVWDQIASDGYRLRYFNDIIYITEYLPDGLTSNIQSHYFNSPKGYGFYLYQSGKNGKLYGVYKWNQYLSYYYMFRGKYKFREIAKNLHMNTAHLYLRLLGLRVFYKLYDK